MKENRRPRKDLTGLIFGNLTVLQFTTFNKSGNSQWLVQCSCGTTFSTTGSHLLYTNQKYCYACSKKARIKPIPEGTRFGKLTVLSPDKPDDKYNKSRSICRCDCGNTITMFNERLRQNNTKSCGCLHKEIMSLPKGEAALNEFIV